MKATQILCFIFLVVLCWTQNQSSSGTQFQPAPALNQTSLPSISESPADGHFIEAQGLQNLELTHFSNLNSTAGNLTNVTLNDFNRSAAGGFTKHTVTIPGNWTHIESSSQTLSCNALFETTSQMIGSVVFDQRTGFFSFMGSQPLSAFTNATVTLDQIRQMMTFGEGCRLILYQDLTDEQTYAFSSDFSSLLQVTTPSSGSNQTRQAISSDLSLGIWNNALYTYDASSSSYLKIFDFPGFSRWTLKNIDSRVIVAGGVSIPVPGVPTLINSNYTIYTFQIVNNTADLINSYELLNAIENATSANLDIFHSPRLTKFGYGHGLVNGSRIIVVKHVDYERR
jgi:hypothetical protein